MRERWVCFVCALVGAPWMALACGSGSADAVAGDPSGDAAPVEEPVERDAGTAVDAATNDAGPTAPCAPELVYATAPAKGTSFDWGNNGYVVSDAHVIYYEQGASWAGYTISRIENRKRTVLVSNGSSYRFEGLAVDDTHVYFSDSVGVNGRIARLDLADPTAQPEPVAARASLGRTLLLDGDTVYFHVNGAGMRRVPKTGGTVEAFLQQDPAAEGGPGIAIYGDTIYYAREPVTFKATELARTPRAGGPGTFVGTTPQNIQSIGADADGVFVYSYSDSGGSTAALHVFRPDGTSALLSESRIRGWSTIVTRGPYVYFGGDSQGKAAILRAPKAGGKVEVYVWGDDLAATKTALYFRSQRGIERVCFP